MIRFICRKKSFATLSFDENMESENLFESRRILGKEILRRRILSEFSEGEFSAADTDNVADTFAISTASEALVGSAVACAHVVLLVPDLSLAGGIRHWPMLAVPLMVVPRPDFKLGPTVGFEEHCLRPKRPSPHSMILQLKVPSPRWSPPS